jgi:hypothetical protein
MTYQELDNMIEKAAQANRSFTDAEFKSLDRNADGDILELASCFFLISDAQKEQITGDDWTRIDEYEEDMRCMMAEF